MEPKTFFNRLTCSAAVVLVSFSPALAQDNALEMAVNTITEAELAREINILSHDSLAGRNTPGPEIEKAASYLAERFRGIGLEPAGENQSFIHRYKYDPVRFIQNSTVVRMKGSNIRLNHGSDYFMTSGAPPIEGETVFIGTAGENDLPEGAEGKIFIFNLPGSSVNEEWFAAISNAVQFSMANGAKGILFILDPFFTAYKVHDTAFWMAQTQLPIPLVGMTYNAAKEMFEVADMDLHALKAAPGDSAAGRKTLEIRHQLARDTVTAPNVVGLLRGADPSLKDTYVVITAHFDHIGVGASGSNQDLLFNGANDNASGTAGLLELAEAFTELPEPPARSVIFLAVSGEEKGLLGSKAYLAGPPGIDKEDIVANINLDMIGGSQYTDTIFSIGQEYSSLQALLDQTMKEHPELGLSSVLDNYEKTGVRKIAGSDQWSFVREKIPVIFLHDGGSKYYHKPKDEADSIDFDKAARVTKLAFFLSHAIAMDPQKPTWTEEGWAEIEQLLSKLKY